MLGVSPLLRNVNLETLIHLSKVPEPEHGKAGTQARPDSSAFGLTAGGKVTSVFFLFFFFLIVAICPLLKCQSHISLDYGFTH